MVVEEALVVLFAATGRLDSNSRRMRITHKSLFVSVYCSSRQPPALTLRVWGCLDSVQ